MLGCMDSSVTYTVGSTDSDMDDDAMGEWTVEDENGETVEEPITLADLGYVDDCLKLIFHDKPHVVRAISSRHDAVQHTTGFVHQFEDCSIALKYRRFNLVPDPVHMDIFRSWADHNLSTDATRKSFLRDFRKLDPSPSYLQALEDRIWESDPVYKVYYDRALSVFEGKTMLFSTFIYNLERLYRINRRAAVSAVGDISCEDALNFCTILGTKVPITILQVCGYQHSITDLRDAMELRSTTFKARMQVLCASKGWKINRRCPRLYMHLLAKLHVVSLDGILALDISVIIDRLHLSKDDRYSRQVYSLLKLELELANRSTTIRELDIRLPCLFTGHTLFVRMSLRSPWHKAMMDTTLATLLAANTSHFRSKAKEYVSSELATSVHFMYTYSVQQYPDTPEPLRWLLEHPRVFDVERLVLGFGKSRTGLNDRVKSLKPVHSATPFVTSIARVIRVGMTEYFTWPPTLKIGDILSKIDDQRQLMPDTDVTPRRLYRDAEVDRMLFIVRDKPKSVLILLLLREIGLRVTALGHIKYFMLMTEDHVPRHVCNVPEKGKTSRQFVTSNKLKGAIKVYVDSLALEWVDKVTLVSKSPDFYIFEPLKNKPHDSANVRALLRCLQRIACIPVTVHPHCFRHTVIGKLIKAGNSIELISKFMGHKNVGTTEVYNISTVQELHTTINNPFHTNYTKRGMDTCTDTVATALLKSKKQKAMEIIYSYNMILSKCVDDNLSASDVRSQIFARMPDLQSILTMIDDSDDETDCSSV
jgi:integrase